MRIESKCIFRLTCSFQNTQADQAAFSQLQRKLRRAGFQFAKHSHPDTSKNNLIMINLEFPIASEDTAWKIMQLVGTVPVTP